MYKSGIYKWTSPVGKSYIGQAVNLEARKNVFLNPNHRYTSGQSHIDSARVKYGVENFTYDNTLKGKVKRPKYNIKY